MTSGGESKIDTKLFQTTADLVGNVAKNMENSFSEWTKIMRTLRGCWQGDTSDDFKNLVDAVNNSSKELLRALGGYKAALYEIAGIYDNVEKKVSETGKSLKYDKSLR
ncbi:MAG: WXG100 family type VII secretion target [Deltaproteobacteria bacterium]|jgi:WXG100 family type VII secretion target|nr:WXG100 family type VII secretion target [Deltaproteobacteria bacterium]